MLASVFIKNNIVFLIYIIGLSSHAHSHWYSRSKALTSTMLQLLPLLAHTLTPTRACLKLEPYSHSVLIVFSLSVATLYSIDEFTKRKLSILVPVLATRYVFLLPLATYMNEFHFNGMLGFHLFPIYKLVIKIKQILI